MEKILNSKKKQPVATYTVLFDSMGGSLVDSQTVAEGDTATKPHDPTRSGYDFVNWYFDPDDIVPYDFESVVTEDITLLAKWLIVRVSSITLNKTTLALTMGNSETLVATVYPDNAENKNVTWATSNKDVATVSNGTVTAIGEGTATITVTTVDGGKTATCAVMVAASGDGPVSLNINVEQITDVTLNNIEGGTISRSGENNAKPLNLENPELYDSFEWSIERVGVYAVDGPITSNESSFIINAGNIEYNTLGKHAVYLLVYMDGVPYSKTIMIEITE
jgi:uncharacterized repeat protein (TIGR02543 family)